MSTNFERATNVLADDKHYDMGPHGERFLTAEAARSLDAAGLLAPDLPEPSRHNHRGEPFWETEGHTTVSNTGPLPINLTGPFGEGWSMYPIEARDIAYALLAAARHAEGEA